MSDVWQCWTVNNGKVSAPKKIVNPSPCPSFPAAREPMSIAISFDRLRKKEAMMQKANVSHGSAMKAEILRRREFPCVQGSSIEGESSVVRCQCRWKVKSGKESKEKKFDRKKRICSQKRSLPIWLH
jgi:hypothetical protein